MPFRPFDEVADSTVRWDRDEHMDRVGGDHAIFDADSEFRCNLGDDLADASFIGWVRIL